MFATTCRRFLMLLLSTAFLGACGDEARSTDAADAADAAGDEGPDASDGAEAIAPGVFRVVFFDVGTGDATLVQSPSGRTLLVDLGIPQVVDPGHEADAARHVVERIEALTGVRRVDYFLASHYHTDHVGNFRTDGSPIGGIGFAVESLGLEVGTFLDRGRTPQGDSPTQAEYLRWVETKPNRRVIDAPGAGWADLGDGVVVDVLATAGAGLVPAGGGENGLSLPVRVTFGDLEISLAGDLTGDCNDTIVDVETAVAPLMGAVEVYKVDHHGSQTGSNRTWIRTVRPMVSVFPLGENRFGYPHERTVADLGVVGALRYTRDGDVTVESADGASFAVNGMTSATRSDAEESALPDVPLGPDEKTNDLCGNHVDDDGDGYTDCDDWSCSRCPAVTACG